MLLSTQLKEARFEADSVIKEASVAKVVTNIYPANLESHIYHCVFIYPWIRTVDLFGSRLSRKIHHPQFRLSLPYYFAQLIVGLPPSDTICAQSFNIFFLLATCCCGLRGTKLKAIFDPI